MLAYCCSVGVRALEAKVTGHPSCRSAASSPFFDASTWTVMGFLNVKVPECGVLTDQFLDLVEGFLVCQVPHEL